MKFFLSYSRSVLDSVRDIVDALRDGRADVWWDQDLRAGQDWWASIIDQIEACDVFIFMISEKSIQSPYCMAELRYALARNRLVLPYVMDAGNYTIPPELNRIQREAYKNNPTHFVNRLGITCRDINWSQYADRYAPRPSEPNTESEDVVDQLDKALSMASEGYFEESVQILNAVMHYSYTEYGAFCNAWIEQIQLYREIAKLAKRPAMRHLAFPKWDTFLQRYGDEFDPLSIRSFFTNREDDPITHVDHNVRPQNKKSSVKFDIYDAMMQFHNAWGLEEWETAQRILQLIRSSGAKLPAIFDIDTYERELQRYFDEEERNKSYHLIRSMLKTKKPNYKHIYDALQTFWGKYPEYDPDGLADSRDLFAHIWLEAAETYEESDHPRRLKAYNGAIDLKPDMVEAYVARGSFYYSINEYELASGDFSTAIQLNPRDSDNYYYRAFSYASQNLRELAIKDFKTLLKIDPKHRHAEGIPRLIEMLSKERIAKNEA